MACARAGRQAGDITLVAVTKYQPPSAVEEALAAGVCDLGENYVQEAAGKRALFMHDTAARWHLIGHLQRNKAMMAAHTFDMVQSIDSIRLAQDLGRQGAGQGKELSILLQVHLGSEATKSGFAPEQALDAAAEIGSVPGLALQGMMGIAPMDEDARPHFQQLRRLFDALPAPYRQTLSMGMTGDFETAIEEGATMIRIGTALFGPRAN